MSKKIDKRANALKHGVFANILILSWEDKIEFDDLCASLVEEWDPVGPTEEEAVYSIAKAMWRKRRVQNFAKNEMKWRKIDPQHKCYDEALALYRFSSAAVIPGDSFEPFFSVLPAHTANDLRRKFPRKDFQSDLEWFQAIQEEVRTVLLPAVPIYGREVIQAQEAAFLTLEVIKDELALEERIDAMIDRAIKRLIHLKGMKQLLGSASLNGGGDQLKDPRANRAMNQKKLPPQNG